MPETSRGARFTYHGEDGHDYQPSEFDSWVCAICGDEIADHDERPVAQAKGHYATSEDPK
jgi:hypothetical protein